MVWAFILFFALDLDRTNIKQVSKTHCHSTVATTPNLLHAYPQANSDNIYTPAYAIYENDNIARVLLINYVTDPSGASTYTASIGFNGGTVPQQVSVKYLLAPSVAEKTNITWAGQVCGMSSKSPG